MTVVEYEGRIVVVDTGLMFPTPDQLGIDLVLPDFTYLRERADDIEAIFLTHGHEDHVGALPYVLRELGDRDPPIYGGPLTIAMVRSKLDEHRIKDVRARGRRARRRARAGPFDDRAGEDGALDPGHVRARRSPASSAPLLFTGDYKFDQTPVDGEPADVARLAELGREGAAAPVRRLDQRRPPRLVAVGVERRARSSRRRSRAVEGRIVVTCFASNIHRVQQVVDAAQAHGPQGRAGRPVDAQERQHRPQPRPHRDPRGDARRRQGDRGLPRPQDGRDLDRVARASRCRRCAAWPTATTRTSSCARATRSSSRPRRSPATSARSTRRSTASTSSAPT